MKKRLAIIIVLSVVFLLLILSYAYFNNKNEKEYEQELIEFKDKIREDLKEYNMIKRIRQDRGVIVPKINFSKPERLHYYQTFVTPNNQSVKNYVQKNSINSIDSAYSLAVNWTWVSDKTLHNKNELWLKPKQFIIDSPNLPGNPVDTIASDCESQAYTLVSIIESFGFSKENIRVCIGLVDFGSGSGGHAWVQVYDNNKWYELEATSGPYFDDDTNKLVDSDGVGLNYFKTRPYPVEEYWAFFNDIYYYNPEEGVTSTNLPAHWYKTEKHFTLSELKEKNQNLPKVNSLN